MARFTRTLSVLLLPVLATALEVGAGEPASSSGQFGTTHETSAAASTIRVGTVMQADTADNERAYAGLRQLALAGEQVKALQGLNEFLRRDLAAPLRIRAYVTAISIATNIEDWSQAFTLLNEALAYLPSIPEETGRLLGTASHLYVMVGETERAIDLGRRAINSAEASHDDIQVCHASVALAFALEVDGQLDEALRLRERQIEACNSADEPILVANGKFGVSTVFALQGQYAEAIQWAEESLAEFEANGYEAGADNAKAVIARSLIGLRQDPARTKELLTSLSARYRADNTALSGAEVEQLWADLAESHGDTSASIAYLKEAMRFSKEAERNARARQLAYLQVQFDTRLKEQQISLLETEKALTEATSVAAQRRQLLLGTGALGLLVTAGLLLLLLRRTQQDRRRYRWEAEHDGLTGLVNQQQLHQRGEAAFANARQKGTPFTAIAIDIDLFKQINDRHGHAAGDEVLRSMGQWIRSVTDDHDIAARRGGDEFMILLDGDTDRAKGVLQQLRERIAPITAHGQTFCFTISAGICETDDHTSSLEQLLHRADQVLYRAKQQGRDRLVCWHDAIPAISESSGSLVVVGSGIQLSRHISERALSEIRQAQVVFCLVDSFALAMIMDMRPDAINLGKYYAPGKDRRETYREIDAVIMAEVLSGKAVCAVFYGHPGVFADVPHRVIRKTRAKGLPARMEPGISAEACLYADLGIDPGQRGVQSMEATHFLYFDRQVDPKGLVLLWQVALAGDWSCSRLHAEREGLQALVTKLLRWYPPDHEVTLYEAARLPIEPFRADSLRLRDLPDAHYEEFTTLVIPPLAEPLPRDPDFGPPPD